MTIDYHYNSEIDAVSPETKTKWIYAVISGSMIFLGSLCLYQYLSQGHGTFELIFSSITLIGGIALAIYILNGYKPIGKPNYIMIKNGMIHYKLLRQSATEIPLQNIQYVRFEDQDLRLVYHDGEEDFIPLTSIQNVKKRKELEEIFRTQFNN